MASQRSRGAVLFLLDDLPHLLHAIRVRGQNALREGTDKDDRPPEDSVANCLTLSKLILMRFLRLSGIFCSFCSAIYRIQPVYRV